MLSQIRENLKSAKFNRYELAGSLGDLGTFLPLLVGMSATNGLDFAAGLFFAGFFNLVTGLSFALPMAVQPMKAIAAVAISEGLSVSQILAAGVIVSVFICLIGLTGAVTWLNRIIPKSVIRGIQLAVGLSLLVKGIQMIGNTKDLIGLDSLTTGVVTFLLVLLSFHFKKVPVAILVFIVGMLISLNSSYLQVSSSEFELWFPRFHHLGWNDFVTAFPRAALPQIPLTLLNSVIAVCALSADLFPNYTLHPKKVAVSVGLMNLVSAWFGGMPMCHGAGGLAGQYRFGARTNGSIIFLGVVKMFLAVLLGGAFAILCASFPLSILGVMLSFSGLGLALVCRDQSEKVNAFVMLVTTGVSLALNHIAIGMVVGLIISLGINKKIFSFE